MKWWEMKYPEGMKVNRTLDLNIMALKKGIKMITRLLRIETLNRKIKVVKRSLKSNALNGVR